MASLFEKLIIVFDRFVHRWQCSGLSLVGKTKRIRSYFIWVLFEFVFKTKKTKESIVEKSETVVAFQSKKEGNDQEYIHSSTTPDPGYQWESDNATNQCLFLLL